MAALRAKAQEQQVGPAVIVLIRLTIGMPDAKRSVLGVSLLQTVPVLATLSDRLRSSGGCRSVIERAPLLAKLARLRARALTRCPPRGASIRRTRAGARDSSELRTLCRTRVAPLHLQRLVGLSNEQVGC